MKWFCLEGTSRVIYSRPLLRAHQARQAAEGLTKFRMCSGMDNPTSLSNVCQHFPLLLGILFPVIYKQNSSCSTLSVDSYNHCAFMREIWLELLCTFSLFLRELLTAVKCPLSVVFLRLNKPSSHSWSPLLCSSPLTTLGAFHWTCSGDVSVCPELGSPR